MSARTKNIRPNPLTGNRSKVRETPYSKNGWRIVECLKTGMVFLENPPDYTALSDEFAWEKTFAEEKRRRRDEEPIWSQISELAKLARKVVRRRERIVTEALRAVAELAPKHPEEEPIRLIDVGCGDGSKSLAIAQESKRQGLHPRVTPIGIEVSTALSQITREKLAPIGGSCINKNALDGFAGLEESSAEIVILCSFLEHEVNPLQLLKAVNRVLADKGLCIIKVPNFSCLGRRVRQKKWCGFRYPDHVNYFTPDTLRKMIQAADLCVKRMSLLDTAPTGDNMWTIVGRK